LVDDRAVRIHRLELEEFRSYRSFSVDIPERGLRVHGPNGSGKTTLLEAIQLLSTTRPRRGANDSDLINHQSGIDLGLPPYARAVGLFDRDDTAVRIEAYVQVGDRGGAARKTLRIGDRPRRAADVVGLTPTVGFVPDDLDLVLGSPSARRRFLDILLSQIDRQYLRCLSKYAKILAQRNGLLRKSRESGTTVDDQFVFWDEQLVALGAYLIAARVRTGARLGRLISEQHARLTGGADHLVVSYSPSLQGSEAWWDTVIHDATDSIDAAQRVGEAFERQLQRAREQELARGATIIGPHRDDLDIRLGGFELARFGSRGQQRLAVVAIKLAEIDVIAEISGLRPIFLVDDVLSELDERNRRTLLESVAGAGSQLIVTSTDASLLRSTPLAEAGEVELVE